MYWSENKQRLDKLTADLQRYNPGKQIPILFTYFADTSNTESTLEKVSSESGLDITRNADELWFRYQHIWDSTQTDPSVITTFYSWTHSQSPLALWTRSIGWAHILLLLNKILYIWTTICNSIVSHGTISWSNTCCCCQCMNVDWRRHL